MNKDEILKLHESGEKEQVQWLCKNHIIESSGMYCEDYVGATPKYLSSESLAECAFRLRDEFDDLWRFGVTAKELLTFIGVKKPVFQAKPIHWIQAALLVRLEKQ